MKRRWNGKFVRTGDEKIRQHLSESSKNGERIDNIENERSEQTNKVDSLSTKLCLLQSEEGRKITDLEHLADQLQSCKRCEKLLQLH